VVIDKMTEDGEKYLCGYVVLTDPDAEIPDLKNFLAQSLPDYMIPQFLSPSRKSP